MIDGIERRTVNGAVVAMISSGILMSIQIAQLAILSRLLRPEDFGLIAMAWAVTGFVRMFSDVGLSTATVQRDQIDQDFISAVFYINFLVCLVLMLICWSVAPFAAAFFSEPRITLIILASAAAFPLAALYGQHHALMARKMLFYRLNVTAVISTAIGTGIAIICAWLLSFGYWAIVVGSVATSICTMVISWFLMPWKPSRTTSLAAGKPAVSFGLNLLGANLAGWMWKQADNVIIGYRWNAVELGYYSRAYTVMMLPITLVSGPIGSAVIPALSRLQNNKIKWKTLMFSTARIMAFFAGLLSLILAFNSEFIVQTVLGKEWVRSVLIFNYLTISIFPSIIWELSRFIFLSLGRADAMRQYSVAAAILHVAAFAIGVNYGAEGVAISLAVASVLITPILILICCRVAAVGVLELCIQFLPSLFALVVVWVIAGSYVEYIVFDHPLTTVFIKTLIITVSYIVIHVLVMPWHAGWRRDLRFLLDQGRTGFRWLIPVVKR